jgi:2-keto-4-pentenoate hydratase/2-oxohepta-3-ene-1,7-dioic acid hydratase in catechol pathway/SAM-dependent methyltransferase
MIQSGQEPPTAPLWFAKFANSLTGSGTDIVLPAAHPEYVDYEAELAVVIGRPAHRVPTERTLACLAGAMPFNDVSARDLQLQNQLWTSGKAIDSFAPCGPALVTLDEIADIQDLGLRARINGEVVQEGSTREQIFGVAECVAWLSRTMTLLPGDIIATGTPAGVGASKGRFLRDGDTVEIEVDGPRHVVQPRSPRATACVRVARSAGRYDLMPKSVGALSSVGWSASLMSTRTNLGMSLQSDPQRHRCARTGTLLAAAALVGAMLWWRRHPSACPYSQRFWLAPPHPLITRARLREILQPLPGERTLEIGPGTGYYTLPLAEWIGPDGRLDILDIQQQMLDDTMRRAHDRGLENVTPARADAQRLPYPDETFDAIVLVTTLGEMPDQDAVWREMARVLKPAGRVVNGELFGDPHWVSPKSAERSAGGAGLQNHRRLGSPVGYFSRHERS